MGSSLLRSAFIFTFFAAATTLGRTASADIFENAVRRDPTTAEIGRVGRIQTKCTLFFLENTASTVYAVTARHCFDHHNIATWCEIDGIFSTGDAPGSSNGQCTRVVASDAKHDIAVFEATLQEQLSDPLFRLASYTPAENMKLGITGYPADPQRNGAITTTTNCWILGTPGASPFPDIPTMQDKAVHHNCSVYGGNSGGPVWVDGTRDVIGLPFNYHQDDTDDETLDPTDIGDSPMIALMSDFVSVHGAELEAARITVSKTNLGTSINTAESLAGDDDDDSGPTSRSTSTSTELPAARVGCAMGANAPHDGGFFALVALAITALRRRTSAPAQ